MGLGPPDAKPGDIVCVFYSAGPLFVLRWADDDSETAQILGDAYVYGPMELEKMPNETRGPDEIFVLV